MHYKKLLGLLGASATILAGCSTGFSPDMEIEVLEYGPLVLESEQESTENNNFTVEEPDFVPEYEFEVEEYGVFPLQDIEDDFEEPQSEPVIDEDVNPELPLEDVVCEYGVVAPVEEPNYDVEEKVVPKSPTPKYKEDLESEPVMYGPAPDGVFNPEDEEVRAMYGVEPDNREIIQAPIEDVKDPEEKVIEDYEFIPEREVIRMMYGVAPKN